MFAMFTTEPDIVARLYKVHVSEQQCISAHKTAATSHLNLNCSGLFGVLNLLLVEYLVLSHFLGELAV